MEHKKPNQRKYNVINIAGGYEEGQQWKLQLKVSKKTRRWDGYFVCYGGSFVHRKKIREKDRGWASIHLPAKWREDKEIDHDWENGERCLFLTHDEHLAIEAKRRKMK